MHQWPRSRPVQRTPWPDLRRTLVQCFALSGTYSESPRGQLRGAWPQAWWTHVKATPQSRWPLGGSPCGKPEKGLRRRCASCQGRQPWLRAAPCRKPFSGFYKRLTARNTALDRCWRLTSRRTPPSNQGWEKSICRARCSLMVRLVTARSTCCACTASSRARMLG